MRCTYIVSYDIAHPTCGISEVATTEASGRNRDRPRGGNRHAGVAALLRLMGGLLIASSAAAQTAKLPPETQASIESAIAAFMAERAVPGLSVAVVREGEFVWSAGFGLADLENSVPATSQTVYRLASISKTLTSTAAMMLWERGLLDLDAPVQKYYPAFPQKPWPITTRQLLGNLGGIRYYNVPETPYSVSQADPEVGNTRHFKNGIEGGVKFFANDPLVAQPGTHFNYSTQGYALVGGVIEGASAKNYADAVRQSVLLPTGMRQTYPDDRFAVIPRRTRFYSTDSSGAVVHAEFLDASYKVPGGGWLSSAPDMARFSAAMLGDRLVKRATRDLMWTAVKPTDGLGRMAYGLGWQLGEVNGVKTVGHGGSQQGTSTTMLLAPEARAAVVVLTNSDAAGASAIASRLLGLALGLPVREPKAIEVDPKSFESYLGTYQLGTFKLVIARAGDSLLAQLGEQKIPLYPSRGHEFFCKAFDAQIIFVPEGNGRAKELILREGGFDSCLSRIE